MLDNMQKETGRQLKENGHYVNRADYLFNSTTQFNELKTAQKITQFNLNSDLPISQRRDVLTETGSATITKVGPEYKIATTTAGDLGRFQTVQRGEYESGHVLEPGSGFRVAGTPTGDDYFEGGYGDNGNKIALRYDASGYHFIVKNNGVETVINQDEWNLDTLNGLGTSKNPSRYNLDLTKGTVFQSPFVYYGYGDILFELKVRDQSGVSHIVPVHYYNKEGDPAIYEPNLPLFHEVSNSSGSSLDMYVGGRQVSVWGISDNIERTVGESATATAVGADWVPLMSFKVKTGFENIKVQLSGITIDANDDMIYQIQRNATITTPSYGVPENYVAAECATEFDTSGTLSTQADLGEAIFVDRSSGNNRSQTETRELPERPLSEFDTYHLMVKADGTTNVTVKGTLRLKENW